MFSNINYIRVLNCNFTNCQAGILGGAVTCGFTTADGEPLMGDNDINITQCQFYSCQAPSGGALYFMDGTEEGDEITYISNCLFDGCSGSNGTALFCRSYNLQVYSSIFQNHLLIIHY